MRALLLGVLVAFGGGALVAARAQGVVERAAAVEKRQELRFTEHARQRMEQRGVTLEQARAAAAFGESFRYFHDGKWKTGYFDEKQRLFLATDGGVVITVITKADRRYVERLKRKKP
jgi:hypothetical protein